jgi:hypothetical protein
VGRGESQLTRGSDCLRRRVEDEEEGQDSGTGTQSGRGSRKEEVPPGSSSPATGVARGGVRWDLAALLRFC